MVPLPEGFFYGNMFSIQGTTGVWDVPAHIEILRNFFPCASVNRARDELIFQLHGQCITDVFHQQTDCVFGSSEFILKRGIWIPGCKMSQRDGKLHSGFPGLSIVGVLLFYQWDNALKKFVEIGGVILKKL